MRRLPVLFLVASLSLVALPARAAPALLDPAFGGDGIVTALPDGAIATACAIYDNRRIVAAVYTTSKNVDVAVARFEPDGSPDASFGAHGHRRKDLGGDDYALATPLIHDGAVVVRGRR